MNDSDRRYVAPRLPPWDSFQATPDWLIDQQLAFQDISRPAWLLEQQAQAWLLLMPQRLSRQRGALAALVGESTLWGFFCEVPTALRAMVIEGRGRW